ncbi:EamA family transporter [Paenibacillus sp. F411]|nr:EamA family transporter [Paenibacillus sp. F411]
MLLMLCLMTLLGSSGAALFKVFSIHKKSRFLLFGILVYGFGAWINIYLLQILPYTIVVPANALTFLWTLIIAKYVFGERIAVVNVAGVICIGAGIWFLVQ